MTETSTSLKLKRLAEISSELKQVSGLASESQIELLAKHLGTVVYLLADELQVSAGLYTLVSQIESRLSEIESRLSELEEDVA